MFLFHNAIYGVFIYYCAIVSPTLTIYIKYIIINILMEPTEQQKLEWHFTQVLVDEHAKIVFDDLFTFASEVCLPSIPRHEAKPDISPEQEVIRTLGLRGVRAALEMQMPHIGLATLFPKQESPEPEEESEGTVNRTVLLDSPMVSPELFSNTLDADIQQKIELFGRELLKESYKVLGEDVDQKIAELNAATSADEQMAVVDWLDQRIESMVRDEFETIEDLRERQSQEFAYQPFRLSPKVLGVYPNLNERPTCLGISIIAASFFRQANVPIVHAGVAMGGHELPVYVGRIFTSSLTKSAHEKAGVLLPDPAQEAILRTSQKMKETDTREDAQHAATYAKLMDGSWVQFDPNFVGTMRLRSKGYLEVLSQIHTELEEMSPLAPGTEVVAIASDTLHPTADIMYDVVKELTPEYMNALRGQAAETLRTVTVTELAETIYQDCISPFFSPKEASERMKADMLYLGFIERDIPNTSERESVLRTAYHNVLQKYLLWGASPEDFVSRLETDESYFANRVEDLINLPFLIMAAVAKIEAEDFTPWYAHPLLEIGTPEYRIGAATLSDFALYYDFELPPSFWQTYWPGSASVIEHLVGDTSLHRDFALSFNNALYHELHPFTSHKNDGIIKSFLEENVSRRG